MPHVTLVEQKLLDFIRQSGFIATIKNTVLSFHRDTDKTEWPEGQNLPLGGEVHLEDHEPAHVINNAGKARFKSLYESVGFGITVKFGEGQNRGKETERRVTVRATICSDAVELYFIVRLYNVDGRTHEPGRNYIFDSRYDTNLPTWITDCIKASDTRAAVK